LKASSRRQRSVISQGRRMALHQPATSRQLAFSNKAISRGRWAALRLSATTESLRSLRLSATAESLRLSATAESISHQAAIRWGRRLWPISHQAAKNAVPSTAKAPTRSRGPCRAWSRRHPSAASSDARGRPWQRQRLILSSGRSEEPTNRSRVLTPSCQPTAARPP
jgi:hypothetical protein